MHCAYKKDFVEIFDTDLVDGIEIEVENLDLVVHADIVDLNDDPTEENSNVLILKINK